MATNKALLWRRAVRSFFGRHIACRSFVTGNLNKIEDVNKGVCISDVAKDAEVRVWWDVIFGQSVCISDVAKDSEVRVWWDVQRCEVPLDRDVGNVMRNIRDALRRSHCFGPVEFWGYGDMTVVPFLTQSRLHNAGVRLRHVPFSFRGDLQEEVMIADLIAWTKYHPAPAVHMLASKMLDYGYEVDRLNRALDILRDRGYDALVVTPNPGYPLDVLAWPWETLLAGPKE